MVYVNGRHYKIWEMVTKPEILTVVKTFTTVPNFVKQQFTCFIFVDGCWMIFAN